MLPSMAVDVIFAERKRVSTCYFCQRVALEELISVLSLALIEFFKQFNVKMRSGQLCAVCSPCG